MYDTKLLFIYFCLCGFGFSLEKVYLSVYLDTHMTDDTGIHVFYAHQSSLQDCIEDCKSRKRCHFINYQVRSHLCFSLGTNSSVTPSTGNMASKLTYMPGYLFSARKEWFSEDTEVCGACPEYGECSSIANANDTSAVSNSTCKSSGCKDPSEPRTILYGTQYMPGNEVKYVCRNGYTLVMSSTNKAECQQNGEWSAINFTCLYDCGKLTIENGQFTAALGTTFGMSAKLSCNSGYEISGNPLITCTETGWSDTATCVPLGSQHLPYEIIPAMIWSAAKSYCESLCGHLVDVNSYEEQLIIEDLIEANGGFAAWTGGNDITTEGKFRWSDDTLVSSSYQLEWWTTRW
ncbi:sushi, von Willebrand factor type A, EGF and pentraxin domain-containing protein 1-like [Mercenaria mercenaria]|uniref:sushi, von Willebrand factor type A, EGF and pentraxin domain-containing protein 1-like n=1 Tax=Mercenaria mercenaria TaxID=6596 RepID=UPI00234F0D6C|nr:sushi, von Willebrand factor type A, EGF and pentraxin domain-containing protein 1-like [Mercenaria mercenaria]